MIDKPVNVNFTERLIENLYESHKSWKICEDDYKTFEEEFNKSADASHLEYDRTGALRYTMADGDLAQPKLSVVELKLRKALSRKG